MPRKFSRRDVDSRDGAAMAAVAEPAFEPRTCDPGLSKWMVGKAEDAGVRERQMWLFDFPTKFDIKAFSALKGIRVPEKPNLSSISKRVASFRLGDQAYALFEDPSSQTRGLVGLFCSGEGEGLRPGAAFRRLFSVVEDLDSGAEAEASHGKPLETKRDPVGPERTTVFRPIGCSRVEGKPRQKRGKSRQKRGKSKQKAGGKKRKSAPAGAKGRVGGSAAKKRKKGYNV